MKSERYTQLENAYLGLGVVCGDTIDDIIKMLAKNVVDRKDYRPSTLTNDTNDYDYFENTLRFWFLTQMIMEDYEVFNYFDDVYKLKSSVIYWINKVFNKDYDKYLMAKILIGNDCVNYWSLRKEFKYLLKKVSDVDIMTRWILRFIEFAEERGYYNFSSFYAESALTELGNHNILNASTRSTLEKHIRNR